MREHDVTDVSSPEPVNLKSTASYRQAVERHLDNRGMELTDRAVGDTSTRYRLRVGGTVYELRVDGLGALHKDLKEVTWRTPYTDEEERGEFTVETGLEPGGLASEVAEQLGAAAASEQPPNTTEDTGYVEETLSGEDPELSADQAEGGNTAKRSVRRGAGPIFRRGLRTHRSRPRGSSMKTRLWDV